MTSDIVIIIKELGGMCPVQGEGTINGEKFYFRARGEHWSMSIGEKEDSCYGPDSIYIDPVWYYEEAYGTEMFAAGCMEPEEAIQFIAKAAYRCLKEKESPNG